MFLIFVMNFWREVMIATLVVLVAVMATLYIGRGNAIDTIKTEHALQQTAQRADFEEQARNIERANYQGVIDAVNQAQKRAQLVAIDVASANSANNRLHDTIDELQARAAYSTRDRIEYTNSVGELFKNCTSVYIDLAAKADGHVNDIRLLQGAKPK